MNISTALPPDTTWSVVRPRALTPTEPAALPRRHGAPLLLRARPADQPLPLGQLLVNLGYLSGDDLLTAVALQSREDARFGDILLAHGMIDETRLYRALALQHGTEVADLRAHVPDVRLIDMVGPTLCLREGILPWRQIGGTILIACARPERFADLRRRLPRRMGRVRMVIASETEIHAALLLLRRRRLVQWAEARVPAHESCRDLKTARFLRVMTAIVSSALTLGLLAPHLLLALLTLWATITLAANAALKLAAAVAQTHWRQRSEAKGPPPERYGPANRLPIVSIMVPLYHERAIASRLIKRLEALDYPRELLDICLVVEEDDIITRDTLADVALPRWMRQIVVPRGAVRTKPRALNFALDFCRGSIVGVYDAEDAPAPDQIHRIVRRFHDRPKEVACLQGVLDFYNSRTNWLARCFTIEYATWFRLILPGLERLGLAVPLGGTTLFFRREALERLGGWDAHNVTEDADLGIRLARHGLRTELIHTITQEEANCRAWPWIKQRSRWLKGYAMTWAVHMRDPVVLWRELGAWRFLGVQVLFLGTLSQFLLAPLLWSFWAIPLGLWHPLRAVIPPHMLFGLGLLFFGSEMLSIVIGILAVRAAGPSHQRLWIWVPTLQVYFPLATLAAAKALWELARKPFFWDKTAHGVDLSEAIYAPPAPPETAPALPPALRPLTLEKPAPDRAPLAIDPRPALAVQLSLL